MFFFLFLHFGICAGMILLNEAPKLTGQTGKRKGNVFQEGKADPDGAKKLRISEMSLKFN